MSLPPHRHPLVFGRIATRLRTLVLLALTAAVLVAPTGVMAASSGVPAATSEAGGPSPLEPSGDSRWAAAVAQSANEAWLRNMYGVVLRRVADSGGIDYWLGFLPAGGSAARETVVGRFLFSEEGARGEVDRAYNELLGRAAEPGGRAFWTSFLQVHPVTVLRSNLLASNERVVRSGSTAAWLDDVYVELLERHVDAGGRDFWLGQLLAGRPRYHVVSSIYHSPEGLGFRVDALYQQVLGRAPSEAERSEGIAIIASLNERRLRGMLLASDEYYEQFVVAAVATLQRADRADADG